MRREEHLLAIVAEECGETAQRAMKAQRFGLDEAQSPEHDDNTHRLLSEFNDIVSTMEILHEEGYFGDVKTIFMEGHKDYKLRRINMYLERSKLHGKYDEG